MRVARLRRAAATQSLRFISDNLQRNSTGPDESDTFLNLTSGEMVIRHLRGRQFDSPILISCTKIRGTRYVETYSNAGSTSDLSVCRRYLEAMVGRAGKPGEKWTGFSLGVERGKWDS